MNNQNKIGFGGGCHWCTEAVFQHLKGVTQVEQGWIASTDEDATFSEAVIVSFNENEIDLPTLIEIHLHTHKSTSNHSFRKKYRSAIYTFSEAQEQISHQIVDSLQASFNHQLITKVLPFIEFKASREDIQNYYKKNPTKPFCEIFINPKLKILMSKFSKQVRQEELKHLKN